VYFIHFLNFLITLGGTKRKQCEQTKLNHMNRRDAVKSVAFLMAGTLSATTIGVFLEGCNPAPKKDLFSSDQEKTLAELADTILPDTKTPGAKAAGVGPFIAMMVKECYPEHAQKAFLEGLEDLEAKSNKQFNKSFIEITAAERSKLLNVVREETIAKQKAEKDKTELEKKQKQSTIVQKSEKEEPGKPLAAKERYKETPYFFAIARDLTLLGYFTSEIGASQAMEYIAIPGHYDGCVDMKPGQRAYSS